MDYVLIDVLNTSQRSSAVDTSLGITYRTIWDVLRTSRSPRDVILPRRPALIWYQKESPSIAFTEMWSKCFLQARKKDRGGFVELGHFDKHFVKNTRIKPPAGKTFGIFSARCT